MTHSVATHNQDTALQRWGIFATVASGTFMVNIDISIMNVALPSLAGQYGASPATLQWVVSAYLLVITAILPIVGTLSDSFNRKNAFILGVFFFTLGSVLCAFANGIHQLILFRIIQSIGGAMIMGNVMSIVTYVFPAGQRGRPLGIIGSVVAAGTIVGPAIGGILITTNGWRSIFWVNVPIGIASIVASMVILMPIKSNRRFRNFDYLGSMLFLIGLVSLMLSISEGSSSGWRSIRIAGLFLTSFVSLSAFIWRELHVSNPVIDLSLFRSPTFTLGNAAGYLSYVMIIVPGFLLPLWMHNVLNIPTEHIGLLLTPQAISMILFSPLGGWLSDKFGGLWPATVGLLLATIGLTWMALLNTTSTDLNIISSLSLFGMGMGMFTSPNNVTVLESVPIEKSGLTGSLIATVRNFGRVSGVALTVMFLQMSGQDLQSIAGFSKATSFAFKLSSVVGVTALLLVISQRFLSTADKTSTD